MEILNEKRGERNMGHTKKKRYEVTIGTSYEIEAETPEEAQT